MCQINLIYFIVAHGYIKCNTRIPENIENIVNSEAGAINLIDNCVLVESIIITNHVKTVVNDINHVINVKLI